MHHVAWHHATADNNIARRLAELTVASPTELGPVDPEALAGSEDEVAAVEQLVQLVPDWTLTLHWAARQAQFLGPILHDAPARQIRRALLATARSVAQTEKPRWGDLAQSIKLVPGGLSGLLDAPHPTAPHHVARPVHVRLHTIRGGWWAERRSVVEGGPSYALPEITQDVTAKFARGVAARTDVAHRVLDSPPVGATELVELLAS
jgi:hypothetical protein